MTPKNGVNTDDTDYAPARPFFGGDKHR